MEKTRITVTTHFDGTEDATALFSELIALEMVELGKIISFPGSEKNALEKERESSYNDGVANNLNHVSGL